MRLKINKETNSQFKPASRSSRSPVLSLQFDGNDQPDLMKFAAPLPAKSDRSLLKFDQSPLKSDQSIEKSDQLLDRFIANRYRIEELIAKGGMANVYRARRENLGDLIAIKIVQVSSELNTTVLKRFRREAAAAASINHPHVIRIHDFDIYQDLAYLVMELMAGPSLAHEIQTKGALCLTRALTIFKQICAGVAAAHKEGVIHRDLKPSNVIFQLEDCEDDQIKVVDFGIAKLIGTEREDEKITAANMTLGTPEYMSPEQCLGEKLGHKLDERSDIYSLGVMLFEMLTGIVPFQNAVASATIIQHAIAMPPSASRINTALTTAIDAIIFKALEKNPEKRFRSALEMATEFELACYNCLEQRSNAAATSVSTPTPLQRNVCTETVTGIVQPIQQNSFSLDRFVGRQDELKRLLERFQLIKSGTNNTIFITGEPGGGKTELVERFQQRLTKDEALILTGKFYEEGSERSYQPFLDSIRALLRPGIKEQQWPYLSEVRDDMQMLLDAIEQLLNIRLPNARLLEERTKYRTFEMLAVIFMRLAELTPMVLFLDDIHWADSLSLEFLAYLVRNTQHVRILIIATMRSQDAVDDTRPLKSWLRRISQYQGFDQIRLNPLTISDVSSYVDSFFGNHKISETALSRLQKISGGNPFYLGEILRQLIQEERIRWTGKEWQCAEVDLLDLPDSILELVELNLKRLSNEMIDVFMSAAMIGERFSLKLLQAITDLPKERLLDIIDKGLNESIIKDIQAANTDDDHFHFYHSTLRKVLYTRIPESRRIFMHNLIGNKLEKRERYNAVAGELAFHFYHGNNHNRALFYSVMAGEAAQNIFAIEEALKYYTWAEQSLSEMERLGEQPKYGIAWLANFRLCYGTVLMHIGKNEQALQQFQQGLSMNQQLGLRPFEGKIWCAMGELSWSRGQYQQAMEFCQTGLRLLKAMDDQESLCHLFGVLGDIYFSQGLYEQALDYYHQSLNIAHEIGNRNSEGEALRRIGSVMGCRREGKSALSHLAQALAIARESGNRQSEWLVLMLLGNVYLEQDDLTSAEEHYRNGRQIARTIGRRRGECRIAVNMGEVCRRQGDLNGAKHFYDEAREIAAEIEDREIEGHVLANLGLVYQELHELDLALNSFQEALKIFHATNYRSNVEAESLAGIARILAEQAKFVEAKAYYEQSIVTGAELGLWTMVVNSLRALSTCEFRIGQHINAYKHLQEALNLIDQKLRTTGEEQQHCQQLRAELIHEIEELNSYTD